MYLPLSRLLIDVRRVRRRPAPRPGGVPRPAAAAPHAVRHRPGRLRRRRQVDHRPGAPADARALARAPQRRAGHHRRVPLPQRRARASWPAEPQGLPGDLRPQGAAALRDGHQVRQGRGGGSDVLPSRLRRRPGREGRGPAPRHRDHRGTQRAPARAGPRGRPHRAGAERLLRLHGVRRRGDRGHPAVVRRPVPAACGRRRSATRRRTSPATAGSPRTRRSPRPTGSGTPSTARTSSRTCSPPAAGRPWCCARPPTTRCASSASASSRGGGGTPAPARTARTPAGR